MGERPRFFELESWRVIVEARAGEVVSEATVKLHASGERIVATGEGNGPVHALDTALRTALCGAVPGARASWSSSTTRCASSAASTAPTPSRGCSSRPPTASSEWDTVGVHENVIAASWQALEDACTTGLLRQGRAGAAVRR